METRIAKIISTIFSPLFIPTIGILLLFNIDTFINYVVPPGAKRLIIIIVFINTAIAPLLATLFMKRVGYIKSLQLNDRNERLLPLIIAVLLYFFTYYVLKQASLPSLINFYFLAATFLIIISLFITLTWKVSLHMVSMGGLTGLMLITALLLKADITWLIAVIIMASGLVGSSRLILNRHTNSQVFAGYILGIMVMLILFFIFR